MDQETAKRLLIEGGTFVFLGVPGETQFGIDMECWNTEEDFRGIKMIPQGLHYIHYAAVSKATGDVAQRSGFMQYFKKGDFVAKIWDKKTESISKEEITDESLQRLKDNLLHLDKHLAPYPFDKCRKWKILTSCITADLAKRLSPEDGIIKASVELIPTSDQDRPRGLKTPAESTSNKEIISPKDSKSDSPEIAQTDAKRSRVSLEEKESSMLPNLKPKPGTALRFSEIPKDKYPPGSEPHEITKHYLDQSYTLQLVINQHVEPINIIGEFQFAYICFLIGHSLDAFEHWKNIVVLLCSCDDAIHKYSNVFYLFIVTIEAQIEEMPKEFLADIVMNKNLIYKKLREFFRTAYVSKVETRLQEQISVLKEKLTLNLEWDFQGIDTDDEDEQPVIVSVDF